MAGLVVGTAALIGISAVPAVAGGAPVNLIQNGNFVPTTATTSYLVVSAGDSTTIPDWTVVTPSIYGSSGGSVDVTSDTYWNDYNNQAGGYSIDLAGTTYLPGRALPGCDDHSRRRVLAVLLVGGQR